jgi:preprotein translocase subunit SecA
LLAKIFPSKNERELRRLQPLVDEIARYETGISALSDELLAGKTAEFRGRLAQGQTLDDLLPEAFAVVREASKRTMGLRHYDVQMIGGMVLHSGKIAEMRPASDPGPPPALTGKGVHVITVNDHLAERDSRARASSHGEIIPLWA